MIESLIRSALKQRLIVAVVAAILMLFGLDAARKLSVDAFPDVTNIQVQIATEAPGRSPEEETRPYPQPCTAVAVEAIAASADFDGRRLRRHAKTRRVAQS